MNIPLGKLLDRCKDIIGLISRYSSTFNRKKSRYIVDLESKLLLDHANQEISLRRQAFQVLEQLIVNQGKPVTKEKLIDAVWRGTIVTDDSLVKAIGDIRKALDDSSHKIVRTVHKRGYMLVDDSRVITKASECRESKGFPTLENVFRTHSRWVLLAMPILISFSFISHKNNYWFKSDVENMPDSLPTIAVLKFKSINSSHEDLAFTEGFTEDIISELARIETIRIVSRHSAFAITDRDFSADKISDLLGARFIVNGQVEIHDEQLFANIEIFDADIGDVVGSFALNTRAHELDDSRKSVIDKIILLVQGQTEESSQLIPRQSNNLDTYLVSLRLLSRKHTYRKKDYLAARKEAKVAIELNPDYAPLWIDLAFLNFVDAANQITGELGPRDYQDIENILQTGIDLDQSITNAWHVKSLISGAMGLSAESLTAARKAIDLAPNDPESLLFYAKALLANGHTSSARQNIELARKGFPIVPSYFHAYDARIHWVTGNFDESIAAAENCIKQIPQFTICWVQKIISLHDANRLQEAIEAGKQLLSFAPDVTKQTFGRDFVGLGEHYDRRIVVAEFVGVL